MSIFDFFKKKELDTNTKLFEDNERKGFVGTKINGNVFEEDYLSDLRGKDKITLYDKMRRGDSGVKRVLRIYKMPLRCAEWDVESVDASNSEYVEQAKTTKDLMFGNVIFQDLLNEILTFFDFGFSVFEPSFEVTQYNGKSYWRVKDFGYRNQKTIYRWHFNGDEFFGITQYIVGQTFKEVFIPAEKLIVFTHEKEGNNLEGISLLRDLIGSYKRKLLKDKIDLIGIEKSAIGIPAGEVPAGKESSKETESFKNFLYNYSAGEHSYLLYTTGYKIDILKNQYDARAVRESIEMEDIRMLQAVLAQFLSLGYTGTGSFAMSKDQSDIFFELMEGYGKYIEEKLNYIIKKLEFVNFGKTKDFSQFKFKNIKDEANKAYAEILEILTRAGLVKPTPVDEDEIRKRYKLPAVQRQEETQPGRNQKQEETQPGEEQKGLSIEMRGVIFARELTPFEKRVDFDIIKRKIEEYTEDLTFAIKNALFSALEKYLVDLRNALNHSNNYYNTVAEVEITKTKELKEKIQMQLAKIIKEAGIQAKKEIMSGKKLDIQELKGKVKSWVIINAEVIAESKIADLEKKVKFAALKAIDDKLSIQEIVSSAKLAASDYIENSNALGAETIIADALNKGRKEAFEDEAGVIGYQYSAILDDRTTNICRELDKQTRAIDDTKSAELDPPNHFNCRSILVPIMAGEMNPKEFTGFATRYWDEKQLSRR